MAENSRIRLDCSCCGKEIPTIVPDNDKKLCFCVCEDCQAKMPNALITACQDKPWQYALGLKDGTVIEFEGASVQGDWIHLERNDYHDHKTVYGYPMERGMEVRLSEIVWCANAPNGS